MNHDIRDHCYNSNQLGDDFVGIKVLNGDLKVVFPLGYKIPSETIECQKSVVKLVNNIIYHSNTLVDLSVKGNLFFICLKFIQNYYKNGFFTEYHTTISKGYNGKISWKKTLNHIPLISNNQPYYKTVYSDKITTKDSLLLTIEKYCLYVSLEISGFMYGHYNFRIERDLNLENKYLRYLYEELRNCFRNDKKVLILSMISILEVDSTNLSHNMEFGTREYHSIWEKMIDTYFYKYHYEVSKPNVTWDLKYGVPRNSPPMVPDTVINNNNKIYIIDAKYYKYGISFDRKDIPDNDSVRKQVIYLQHIRNEMINKKELVNCFIIPTSLDKENYSNYPFDYAGVSTVSWEKGDFNKVHLLLMDITYLIENDYLENEREELFSMI